MATQDVSADLTYLQRKDLELAATNASTHSRVVWSSVLSILVLLGLGAAQVVYLKQFFKSKKVID